MALVKANLKSALQSSMESYPASAAAAAQGWADAIANHVGAGKSPQNVSPTPATIAAGKPALVTAITSAFQAGSAAGASSGIASGVVAFYQGLLFTGITPGSVTAITGAAALGPALSSAFSDNTSTSVTMAEAAARFADAVHACSQSVIVTHIPQAYVVGPLT